MVPRGDLAGDAPRPGRAAARDGVRPRVLDRRGQEDVQEPGQLHRDRHAAGVRRQVQPGLGPLVPDHPGPAGRQRRRLRPRAVRGGLQQRPGQQRGQLDQPRGEHGGQVLRRHDPGHLQRAVRIPGRLGAADGDEGVGRGGEGPIGRPAQAVRFPELRGRCRRRGVARARTARSGAVLPQSDDHCQLCGRLHLLQRPVHAGQADRHARRRAPRAGVDPLFLRRGPAHRHAAAPPGHAREDD